MKTRYFNFCALSRIVQSRKLVAVILLFSAIALYGQEHEETAAHEGHKHGVSIIIGHTHVPRGVNGINDREALIVPSWGLNYDYHINEKWAIGWHNDMEIATYFIKDSEGDEIERERPVITSLMGVYRPGSHLSIHAGFGRELEKHESFWVFRLGLEVEIEINDSWALAPALNYDLKETVYDAWSLGLATIKQF